MFSLFRKWKNENIYGLVVIEDLMVEIRYRMLI